MSDRYQEVFVGCSRLMIRGRLDQKVCVVTGAGNTGGIGFATAVKFAEGRRQSLSLAGLAPKLSLAEDLARTIHAQHSSTETLALESVASDEAATKVAFERVVRRWGRLDALGEHYVLHLFFCIKHATPAMQALGGGKTAPGGSIVINGSAAGVPMLGARLSVDYTANKAVLASQRICVNSIGTSAIESAITSDRIDNVIEFTSKAPGVGRTGKPEVLASDESSYVIGATWLFMAMDSAIPMHIKQKPGLPPRFWLD
ncbi:NAD(P)-binding protein [Gonapodya prolifera JEL478]|uniref:NAD(P)-binding protein n=1 Tax=Gonapodya prolifera (strain JEL478) TaxID=1344416 RepID=A0A139AB52_GONPJ|nr:NAD(P)-binding protein [Gonapodya prolifera JEL478]|eukprot:KXS14052.1 NAD(P)-binding protein [Gonapodya prolifera JEL478]